MWVARGITREHGVFWMHDKPTDQPTSLRDTFTVLFMVPSTGREASAMH